MKKKKIFQIVRVPALILLSTFLTVSCLHPKRPTLPIVSVVPASSPVFLKINDLQTLSSALSNENEWWSLLCHIEGIGKVNRQITHIDSLLKNNILLQSFFSDKEVVVALFPSKSDNTEILLVIPALLSGEQKKAEGFIAEYTNKEHLTITKRKISHSKIYEATDSTGNIKFGYAFCQKYLVLSPNPARVEETAINLEYQNEERTPELTALLKTTNHQANVNIFVNHQIASEILSDPLSPALKEIIPQLKNYATWTELDVTIKDDRLLFSGFTNGKQQESFSALMRTQQPGISKVESVLPANTAFFSSYYISDIQKFFNNLARYNSAAGHAYKPNTNLQNIVGEIFDGEIGRACFSSDNASSELNTLLVMKTQSGSFALNKLKQLPGFKEEDARQFRIDNQASYTIYKSPYRDWAQQLFGNMFPETNTEWFALYGNYLIFSDSYNALGKVILSNILGETLLVDASYNQFLSGLSSKNNYYFYCNPTLSFPHINMFFNENISQEIGKDEDFRKFIHFAWQVSASGDMVYNKSCIIYNRDIRFKPQTVWQSLLNAPLATKPLIIENKYDLQNKEIVLSDAANNLYLLNNVGRIVWQINTGSPILGDINLIDMEKNGEIQLVFNTREKLFVIDRKGNAFKNFPINFNTAATNGVAVFDYENNSNYRFFFACDDQMIYAYDTDGKPVEGWQPPKTDHPVNKPAQHFAVDGKDYIVVSDRMKDYIFDRRGNMRVPTDFVYQHSANNVLYLEKRSRSHEPRLVGTDSGGNLHYLYFNGKHETVQHTPRGDNHYFLVANADSDSDPEYIFTQGNQLIVQKSNGDSLFTITLNEQSIEKPSVYTFSSKDIKIGVTSPMSNKIYLFNNNGALQKGFPLDGCTGFSIGFISDDRSRFNLLVGSPDGYLYNYWVE